MFFLSLIEHTLRLSPHLLDLPLSEAIKGELESLFLDKVEFRLVMFGLFVKDIITAKLKRIGRQWLKKLCSTKSMLTVNESFPGPVIRIHKGNKVYVNVQNEACKTSVWCLKSRTATSSTRKLELMKSLGTDLTIDYTKEKFEDWQRNSM
ncbi:uncharacterized protein LOC100246423 isoform X5 [Vitis vinifera]|uniref:uncharacterized protein LOC100246423 isoform X5 n=1 Tax=Vitis vinifera TaxID=29760 RepID=UPI002882DB94|nr:uncharacterized protein LOC100246423 isoform X5 [Vitis vinifera]